MYHISIYFDERTEERLSRIIKDVANRSGNTFMRDNNVPPHITACAFECDDKLFEVIKEALNRACLEMKAGDIYFAGVGQFMPDVMYVTPVLNEYLHGLSKVVYDTINCVSEGEDTLRVSKYYRPFQWLPHVTVAKTLSKEQMGDAFVEMQNTWGAFGGKVTKIGLAKTNPYKSIKLWSLEF